MLAGEGLNLVPLVDVLVSILFFSLLTYTGAVGILTAFDLRLPPVVVTAQEAAETGAESVELLLVVRIQGDRLLVEHGGNGGFSQAITGETEEELNEFRELMAEIRQQYPRNSDVLVIPDDATSYERVVHVLERLKLADYTGIALGTRARATQIASAGR